MNTTGVVQAFDNAERTFTLADGRHFKLAPEAKLPLGALGSAVSVTYEDVKTGKTLPGNPDFVHTDAVASEVVKAETVVAQEAFAEVQESKPAAKVTSTASLKGHKSKDA